MKVLIGPNWMGLENGLPDLRDRYGNTTFEHCADRAELAEAIADAEVYVGWLDADAFSRAKRLRWIQSPSSGVNYYLAIPELVESDVLLTSASGTHAACLAESTFGMILAFTRGIRDAVLYQQQHEWAGRAIRPKLVELMGSTMGIVGLGRVGCALAERARAFGMRVLAVDLYSDHKPDCVDELSHIDRLDELLRASDYAVVTVPYTANTEGMIGAEELALMKPSAMLVGISRGGIIDQAALGEALREGRLAAAALDVTRPEPLPADSELWDVENLLIMPHVAGGTQFEGQYVLEIFAENLGRLLRGDLPLRNQVDKGRGF
ncbi:MAG TPA: D-2-hydroxyacid dehydrogenase [Anaerolineae bacterium]|nr:D-2-hydroxyacid dehydrogenase [Anaerolineae bacterium]